MKYLFLLLLILAALPALSAERNWKQLIPDVSMKQGITLISQKDHTSNNEITEQGVFNFYGREAEPLWRLAQWDSGPDLYSMIKPSPNAVTDGKWRSFGIDRGEMTFLLDTSLYYNGRPAKQGEYWPHLLIESGAFGGDSPNKKDNEYYLCSAKRQILTFDFCLPECTCTPIEGDWVRAAQFLMYFYVRGINNDDFCWFGMSLYDNRPDMTETYINIDGGKPDASGRLIYCIGSRYLFDSKINRADGKYHRAEIDLHPYMEDMLAEGRKRSCMKSASLDELRISGMNLGWETIGTFRHTAKIRNLKLTAYKERE